MLTRSKLMWFLSLCLILSVRRGICGASDVQSGPFSSLEQTEQEVQTRFQEFTAAPSVPALKQMEFLIKSFPGMGSSQSGIPAKDIKLSLMVQYLATIDGIWENKRIAISPYPQLPPDVQADVDVSGEDPSDVKDPAIRSKYIVLINEHNKEIERHNLQDLLGERRNFMSQYIPIFVKYSYIETEKPHWQSIIKEGLTKDSKGGDLLKELLGKDAP